MKQTILTIAVLGVIGAFGYRACRGSDKGASGETNYIPIFTLSGYSDSPTTFEARSVRFGSNGGVSVSLTNGAVTLGEGVTVDEGSRLFWTNVTTCFPTVQKEIAHSFLGGVTRDELIAEISAALRYLQPSFGPFYANAVYKTPAARLREEADAIEARDASIERLKRLLERLQTAAQSKTTNHP